METARKVQINEGKKAKAFWELIRYRSSPHLKLLCSFPGFLGIPRQLRIPPIHSIRNSF